MNPKKSPQDTYNQLVESQRENFENSKRKVAHYIQRSPLRALKALSRFLGRKPAGQKYLFKVLKEKKMPPRYTTSDKTVLQK